MSLEQARDAWLYARRDGTYDEELSATEHLVRAILAEERSKTTEEDGEASLTATRRMALKQYAKRRDAEQLLGNATALVKQAQDDAARFLTRAEAAEAHLAQVVKAVGELCSLFTFNAGGGVNYLPDMLKWGRIIDAVIKLRRDAIETPEQSVKDEVPKHWPNPTPESEGGGKDAPIAASNPARFAPSETASATSDDPRLPKSEAGIETYEQELFPEFKPSVVYAEDSRVTTILLRDCFTAWVPWGPYKEHAVDCGYDEKGDLVGIQIWDDIRTRKVRVQPYRAPSPAEQMDVLKSPPASDPAAPERPDLSPCPFCGGAAELLTVAARRRWMDHADALVECQTCEASIDGIDDATAVSRWNKRVPSPIPEAEWIGVLKALMKAANRVGINSSDTRWSDLRSAQYAAHDLLARAGGR